MRLWDTLKTAWNLAQRVQGAEECITDLQKRFEDLNDDWTDVLDKLRARDERQRKRDQRALKGSRDSEPDSAPSLEPPNGVDHEALRERARQLGLMKRA